MKRASRRDFSSDDMSSKCRISESRFIAANDQRAAARWQGPGGGRSDERYKRRLNAVGPRPDLHLHQAGKKSIGFVTVIVPTSFASNWNSLTRATSLRSSSGSLSSLDTTSQRE